MCFPLSFLGRDALFLPFDDVLASEAIEIVRTPPKTPRCNAYAERFVREARETLDCLIVLGEGHLRHALRQIEEHHNAERPHQGIGNQIPGGYDYPVSAACARGQPAPGQIKKRERLGGLLNHYYLEDAA